MKIGELFRDQAAALYPTPDQILERELANAKRSYPQRGDKYDEKTLLAFQSSTLRKNLAERTDERERYAKALATANQALIAAGLPLVTARPAIT